MTTFDIFQDQGHTAYHSGQDIAECPYAEGTPEADAWTRGWTIAEQAEADHLDELFYAQIAAQDAAVIRGFDYV